MIATRDLERVILGVVHKKGPCTPYVVRKEFEGSPSSHFSSSPGSIYPIIRRLEKAGWLESRVNWRGRRRGRLYALTAEGRKILRQWITPPLDDAATGLTFDPLRTRMYFLSALSRKKQVQFLLHAASRLEAEIGRAKAEVSRYVESGDTISRLAAEGAVQSLRTRLRWIRKAHETLKPSE